MEPNSVSNTTQNRCPYDNQANTLDQGAQKLWQFFGQGKDWVVNTGLFVWSVQSSGGIDFFVDQLYHSEDKSWTPCKWLTVAHKIKAAAFTSYDYWPLFAKQKGREVSGGEELGKLGTFAIGHHTPLTIDDTVYHKEIKKLCMNNNFGLDKIKRHFPTIFSVADRYFDAACFSENSPKVVNISETIIQYISRANVMALFAPPGSKAYKEIKKFVFQNGSRPNPKWDEIPRAVEAVGQYVSESVLYSPNYFANRAVDKVVPQNVYQTEYQKNNDILSRAAKQICDASKKAAKSDFVPDKHHGKAIQGIIEAMINSEKYSYEQMESIVRLILVIGQRTTAVTIESCVKNLILFPEWQEILFKEIEEKLKGKPIDHENVANLEELDNFIWETLRLNPPVPVQTRDAEEDLNFKGMKIPKKTTMAFVHYAAQRDPKYFPEPHRFNPNRFKEEAKLKNLMKTFSQYRHNCCGKQLALTGTIKAALVKLISESKIHAANLEEVVNMKHMGGIILKHDRPLLVSFEKR